MSRTAADSNRKAGKGRNGRLISKPWHIAGKLLRLISVDGDNFYKSKDWPYLWPTKHL